MRCAWLPFFLLASFLPASSLLAASPAQNAPRFAVHLVPHDVSKGSLCEHAPAGGFACDLPEGTSSVVISGDLETGYDAYVVLLDTDTAAGIQSLSFRIEYESGMSDGVGIDVLADDTCGAIDSPSETWPESGSSVDILFGECQDTVDPTDPQGGGAVVAAGFYVYAYGVGTLKALPVDTEGQLFDVADCSSGVVYAFSAGWAGFGTPGCPPCLWDICFGGLPVAPTTWGRVKNTFGDR